MNKNKYHIAIVIPAFRTNKWDRLYKTIDKACQKYEWQLILISPFKDLTPFLLEEQKRFIEEGKNNKIKLISSYSTVPVCLQIGINEADSALVFSTTDDGVFTENSIDNAIDQYIDEVDKKIKDGTLKLESRFDPDNKNAWFQMKPDILINCLKTIEDPKTSEKKSITTVSMVYRRRWKSNGPRKILDRRNTC